MVYRFNYAEAALEFAKNQGRAYLEAASPTAALNATRALFGHTREESVKSNGSGQYLVEFKVALDFRLSLVRQVEKAVRLLRDEQVYLLARYIDRYLVSMVCFEVGKPEWLADSGIDLKEEISTLRKATVVAREVANVRDFVDWDIAIYNYLELNSKPGHRSRVIRKVRSR